MKEIIFFSIVLITSFSFCSQKAKSKQMPETKQSNEMQKPKKKEKIPFDYCSATIKQGLYGCLTKRTGDCMPIIDTNRCKWYAVKRTIFIYEATKNSQAVNGAPPSHPHSNWYTKIKTKLVAEIQSDDNGCYQVQLSVGEYSVLILENGNYYCQSWSDKDVLYPIKIDSNKVIKRNMCIKMCVD